MATQTKKQSKLSLFSPAKVNLFFRVLKKRDDGYHEIASLMKEADFGDTLHFSIADKQTFTSTGCHLCWDKKNLIYQAVQVFKEATGISFNLDIHLEKKTPIGAGLGGGSSNAATTLKALNELFQANMSKKELMHLGSKIGADVPFFFSSGCAYSTGIGEIIEEVENKSLNFIVQKPQNLSLSTPLVYSKCKVNAVSSVNPLELLQLYQKDTKSFVQAVVNDLEYPAFLLKPSLKEYKKDLQSSGFEKVVMTGSGTAFVCYRTQKAEKAL